ncbi:universal stress protein [Acidiferrimicrobium sp. IK]|uniref:universal stress protein n=1 Tax=Acidiferrimicrobium sp. IK TaxID=2871700 RepID=UPI0021CB19D1|nr:universal stress protein [Acidiferrimicrobium sp. IK]MCU4186894.1 universal stress protein [Acidiferrimicrobium sp. IK]
MSTSDTPSRGKSGIVVVGVDGSEPSKEALRWAAEQARLVGARLRVVLSWELPSVAYMAPLPAGLDFDKDAHRVLDEEIAGVLGQPDVDIEKVVAEGHPAPVLLELSKDADLLVVGSRGHGEFAGMLLGSVSEHCVSHATCPVVVVHRREAAGSQPA